MSRRLSRLFFVAFLCVAGCGYGAERRLGSPWPAAAAPVLDPPPDGVVDISGSANLEFAFPGAEDMNALARAPELESPLLYLTARGDTRVPVPEARELVRRAPVKDKRLCVFAATTTRATCSRFTGCAA